MAAQCQMVSSEQGEEGSPVGSRKAYEAPETFGLRVQSSTRYLSSGGIRMVTTGDWLQRG